MKSHRFTPVEISAAPQLIQPTDRLLTIGSCFAQNIASRLHLGKITSLSNPLGIVYNPHSLAKQLLYISQGHRVSEQECGAREGVFFHYDFHSQLSGLSAAQVTGQINKKLTDAKVFYDNSQWIILTLGTAFAYSLIETNSIVANCHKMPASSFDKQLLTIEQSVAALTQVLPVNKKIVVTVSPIRHIKDGLTANQRSKARLIEIAHLLSEKLDGCTYFPAYEVVMDELRDYRYFEKDLIHPSVEAVDIVWERFKEAYFSTATRDQFTSFEKLHLSIQHRALMEGSAGHLEFLRSLLDKIDQLSIRYPNVDLSREEESVRKQLDS